MQKKIVLLFVFIGMFYNPFLFSQDSIPVKVSINEKKNLQFQEFFFKALSEKAIHHYKNAIQYLEECNQVLPNKNAVLFELSKNYLHLNKTHEAEIYAQQALQIEPDNRWVLEHLVVVYKRSRNFSDAIRFQKKLIVKHPKKREQLVFLYLQNKNYKEAISLLKRLKKEQVISERLHRILTRLEQFKVKNDVTTKTEVNKKDDLYSLEKLFEKQKDFTTLKKILEKTETTNTEKLLKYSKIGVNLFPAQPYIYLINGKALNNTKSFKKALESLENGIDFVIDDNKMMIVFYLEMVKSYTGLKKSKEVKKYRLKAKKLQ